MPVPRERKKLDRSAVVKKSAERTPAEQPVKAAQVSKLKTEAIQKLDQAFEIMEQVPYRKSGARENTPEPSRRQGFHWKISLEAVLPEDTSGDSKDSSSYPDRAAILSLGFTIPFFWGWPMMDEMTKLYFKCFKPYRLTDLF